MEVAGQAEVPAGACPCRDIPGVEQPGPRRRWLHALGDRGMLPEAAAGLPEGRRSPDG